MERGGILTAREAKRRGITAYQLRQLMQAGEIVRMDRGLYRLADLPPLRYPDHVLTNLKVPGSIFCLLTALVFHDLTDVIPSAVYVALPRFQRNRPVIHYPPTRIFGYDDKTFDLGVEEHILDQIPMRFYSAERTVIDCFKFRNRIGETIAIEALTSYCHRDKRDLLLLEKYAQDLRMANIIAPYLKVIENG